MAKDKGELIDEMVKCTEKVSDAFDNLSVPHIFIILKNVAPYGVFYSNAGTFLQTLFLALTVLVKVIEEMPALRPALSTLLGVLEETRRKWGKEEGAEVSQPEKMTEFNEAFKEILTHIEQKVKDEGSENQD